MHTRIYTEYRMNTGTEFWHLLPDVVAWMQPYEQFLISSGLMVSCTNVISEDQCMFTRTAVFNGIDDYATAIVGAPFPEFQQLRMLYNSQNDIVWFSETIDS